MAFMNKLHNLKDCRENSRIYDLYDDCSIDDEIVYLESRNGRDFTGNIFRITEELSTGKYGGFKIYVYATDEVKAKINNFKKNYNLRIHKIVTDENEACRILEKAKYIFTDSGIRAKYIKKTGQVFINTWHGTPLKLMGFDNPSERPSLGIIQRCLLFSDYLLYPNEYMMDIMLKAYQIDKIYPGKILLEGYPRNSVFLRSNDETRQKLGLNDKEVFVYMPTFKGIVSDRKDEKQKGDVEGFLEKIDSNLNDDQVLFVKFHPYNQSKIDFSEYGHVKAFPQGFENYDVLNCADTLITDYSSVFFDFAVSKRKIIIFNYDEEEYLTDRGLYIPLDDLPFPKVQNADDLIEELNSPIDYDDNEFSEKFCSFESIDSAEHICQCVVNDKIDSACKIIENASKNILIYTDGLQDNGTLNSLIAMINSIDKSGNNIFISFKPWHQNIRENYQELLAKFPQHVEFLPLAYSIYPTVREKLNLDKFLKNTADDKLYESIRPLFEKAFKKQYCEFGFDLVVDYGSQSPVESLIFANSNCKNAIYINENSNKDIYTKFDKIYKIGEINDIY